MAVPGIPAKAWSGRALALVIIEVEQSLGGYEHDYTGTSRGTIPLPSDPYVKGFHPKVWEDWGFQGFRA